MKIDAFKAQNLKAQFNKAVNSGKNTFEKKIKPAVGESIKYTKNLAHDTANFVKAKPVKVAKLAAAGILAGSAIALGVKAVKDFIKTKKQNAILTDTVIVQRNTINLMKEVNEINKDIIAAKDKTIEELKK